MSFDVSTTLGEQPVRLEYRYSQYDAKTFVYRVSNTHPDSWLRGLHKQEMSINQVYGRV